MHWCGLCKGEKVRGRACSVPQRMKNVFRYSTDIVQAELLPATGKSRDIRLQTWCVHGKSQIRVYRTIGRGALYRQPEMFNCRCNKVTHRKLQRTMLRRYGVANPMQVPAFASKCKASAYSFKEYCWPSGRITQYQGVEHYIYPILMASNAESEIKTERATIRTFHFMDAGLMDHTYYPDAIVGNIVYEVKTPFTYQLDTNIELKSKAVNDENFIFEIYIFTSKNTYWRLINYPDGRRHMVHPIEELERWANSSKV